MTKIDAILETCRERARPVVLTALIAIFDVLPGLNFELMNHETTIGAVNAMMDFPVERDCLWPRLCDHPDTDRDTIAFDAGDAGGHSPDAPPCLAV